MSASPSSASPSSLAQTPASGNFSRDVMASLVVFLVALPLCMGIAIASGAPPAAGLISGIIGGIVVGLLAGAPLQVSGPAAGLAVISFDIIQKYGMNGLAVIIVLAGGMQVVAGLLKLGNWFRAVSPAVIQGMLAGIGVLIFASQFHVMLDVKPQPKSLDNLRLIPWSLYQALVPASGSTRHLAAILGILTLSVIVLWKKLTPAQMRFIPGALIGVILSSALAFALGWKVEFVTVDQLADALRAPNFLDGSIPWNTAFLGTAVGVFVIASAETLLCATALDSLPNNPRPGTNYDRELFAQGIGNLCSGMVGGLPVTGVIVRSATNVDAGATSRWSAVVHGIWILIIAAFAPGVLHLVPKASLAAVLVFTGIKLVNHQAVRQLRKFGAEQVAIYAATVVTTVFVDLLYGVMLGVVLSAMLLLYRFTRLEIHLSLSEGTAAYLLELIGSATFLRLPTLAGVLEKIPKSAEVHVDLSRLDFLDHACIELITNWEKQRLSSGGKLVIDWDAVLRPGRRQETVA